MSAHSEPYQMQSFSDFFFCMKNYNLCVEQECCNKRKQSTRMHGSAHLRQINNLLVCEFCLLVCQMLFWGKKLYDLPPVFCLQIFFLRNIVKNLENGSQIRNHKLLRAKKSKKCAEEHPNYVQLNIIFHFYTNKSQGLRLFAIAIGLFQWGFFISSENAFKRIVNCLNVRLCGKYKQISSRMKSLEMGVG